MNLGFIDIMEAMGKRTDQHKSGNYYCPFCGHRSLSIYPEARQALCHTKACGWKGNPVHMYGRWKGINDFDEMVQRMAQDFIRGAIISPRALTIEEARNEYEADLEFLACVRMYFALNLYPLKNHTFYQKKSGESATSFSRVVNGDITEPRYGLWKRIIGFLRQEIDIKPFKSVVEGKNYFINLVALQEQSSNVNKFLKKTRIIN